MLYLSTGIDCLPLRHFGTKLGTPKASNFRPELEIATKVRSRLLFGPHDADLLVLDLYAAFRRNWLTLSHTAETRK
jgi:hypothetical protein